MSAAMKTPRLPVSAQQPPHGEAAGGPARPVSKSGHRCRRRSRAAPPTPSSIAAGRIEREREPQPRIVQHQRRASGRQQRRRKPGQRRQSQQRRHALAQTRRDRQASNMPTGTASVATSSARSCPDSDARSGSRGPVTSPVHGDTPMSRRPTCSSPNAASGTGRAASRRSASARTTASRERATGADSVAIGLRSASGRREHAEQIAAGEQPAREDHQRPPPLPGFDGSATAAATSRRSPRSAAAPSATARRARKRAWSSAERGRCRRARRCGRGRAPRRSTRRP